MQQYAEEASRGVPMTGYIVRSILIGATYKYCSFNIPQHATFIGGCRYNLLHLYAGSVNGTVS